MIQIYMSVTSKCRTVFARHLLKLFNVSVMVAASSILSLDEVGHSVFPYDVFSVKVLENACQHMRNVLMYKGENVFKMWSHFAWH